MRDDTPEDMNFGISNLSTLTISDYIEKVLEIPVHKELKQCIEKLYEKYEKDPEKFNLQYRGILGSQYKTGLALILPIAFEYYSKRKEE